MDKKSNDMILQKNNLMVKARYNLKAKENKVYLFILYQMQLNVKKADSEILTCEIHKNDFIEPLPDIRDRNVKNISKILSSLRSKPIFFMKEDEDEWGEYGFITSYKKKKGDIFEIKMQSEVIDLLKEYMQGGYTPINIAIMFSLEGYYAQRLYELIRLWSNSKKMIDYNLETLKEYMMLDTKKSYNLYANVKNKVIKPAIEEINKSGFLKISWEEIKEGRRVDILRFYVEDINNKILQNTKEEKEFYIPNPQFYSDAVLKFFKIEFSDIDFKNKYMQDALNYSTMITMDQDKVDIIEAKSYLLFKSILNKQIEEYKEREIKDLQHKEEMAKYW